MSEGDIFREVEQDMRREQLAQYWRKYGLYVIAVALLIVLGVGGYQGWTWWQRTQMSSDGAAFVQASALQQNGQRDAAAQTFSKLAEDGAGAYPALSQLRLAAISAAKGETDAAVKAYDQVAANTDDAMLKGFARVQAATLLVDTAPPAEMEKRIGDMPDEAGPWRHSARELLALSAFKADQNEKARTLYQKVLGDGETPGPMRRRAQMMLSLLDSPGASAAQGAATPSAQSSTN